MSRYVQRDGRTFTRDGWPVCHQRFREAVGRVDRGIFYRVNGDSGHHNAAPGVEVPLIHLVAIFKAKRRGRPGVRKAKPGELFTDRECSAYGVSVDGAWWNVLYNPGEPTARARTLARPPYGTLRRIGPGRGMRQEYGHFPYLKEKAQQALLAAEIAQARQASRCELI
jgi:hypothetical protein